MFYLFMAFAAVWLLVTGYVIYLGLHQRQIEAEMRMLQEEVQGRQK
jgi:CcmD family protein